MSLSALGLPDHYVPVLRYTSMSLDLAPRVARVRASPFVPPASSSVRFAESYPFAEQTYMSTPPSSAMHVSPCGRHAHFDDPHNSQTLASAVTQSTVTLTRPYTDATYMPFRFYAMTPIIVEFAKPFSTGYHEFAIRFSDDWTASVAPVIFGEIKDYEINDRFSRKLPRPAQILRVADHIRNKCNDILRTDTVLPHITVWQVYISPFVGCVEKEVQRTRRHEHVDTTKSWVRIVSLTPDLVVAQQNVYHFDHSDKAPVRMGLHIVPMDHVLLGAGMSIV